MEIFIFVFFILWVIFGHNIISHILYGVGISEWWYGNTGLLGKDKAKWETCNHEYEFYSKNCDECKKCGSVKWNKK